MFTREGKARKGRGRNFGGVDYLLLPSIPFLIVRTRDLRKALALPLELLFVFSLALFSYFRFLESFTLTHFQARDLSRAEALAAGSPIFFGPEMSGGGVLPGGFYYLVLAIPSFFGGGQLEVRGFQLVLIALSVAVLWFFSRRHFGIYPAFFGLICMLPSSNMERQQTFEYWNPGFLPLFFVSALIFLCYSFARSRDKRALPWAAFCVLCGLGGHIHFTSLLLLPPAIALQCLAGPLKLAALPRRDFRMGLLWFAFTLSPHLIWLVARALSVSLGQNPFPNAASTYPDWRVAMFSLDSYKIRPRSLGDVFERFLWMLPMELILCAVILALLYFFRGRMRAGEQDKSSRQVFVRDCLAILSVACLFLLPQALSFVVAKFYRYTIGFNAATQVLTVVFLAWTHGRTTPATSAYLALLAALTLSARELWEAQLPASTLWSLLGVCVGLLAALTIAAAVYRPLKAHLGKMALMALAVLPFLIVKEASPYSVDQGDNRPSYEAQRKISEVIFSQTGWAYQKARQRIFYVNVHNDLSLSQIYADVESAKPASEPAPSGLARIDGYFVVILPEFNPSMFEREPLRELLLSLKLEKSLAAALRGRQLELGLAVPYKNMAIVPYEVRDEDAAPPFFRNRSDGYSRQEVSLEPAPLLGASAATLKVRNCEAYPELCEVTVKVESRKKPGHGSLWQFQVSIEGQSLSQTTDWVSPRWTEAWEQPYLSVTCEGREQRKELADSLGLNPLLGRRRHSGSFLAPFLRRFHLRCAGGPKRVSFGYQRALISGRGLLLQELPARQLSVTP